MLKLEKICSCFTRFSLKVSGEVIAELDRCFKGSHAFSAPRLRACVVAVF